MERVLQQLLLQLLLLLEVALRAMAGTGSTQLVPSVIVMNEGAPLHALALHRCLCLWALDLLC